MILNQRRIPFILSYDGSCGERNYGDPLPQNIARRVLLDVGRSSQATLNGRDEITIESLYVSHLLPTNHMLKSAASLRDFAEQGTLFT
jgi:DNA adenine methylase